MLKATGARSHRALDDPHTANACHARSQFRGWQDVAEELADLVLADDLITTMPTAGPCQIFLPHMPVNGTLMELSARNKCKLPQMQRSVYFGK